jgi:hypothetical protein
MDEIDLLKRFRAEMPGPDEVAVRAARAMLGERMTAAEERPPLTALPRCRTRGGRARWRAAAAIGTALVVVAVLAPVLWPTSGGGEAAAATFLRRMAAVADRQPADVPDDFWYQRSRNAYLAIEPAPDGLYAVLLPNDRKTWIGPERDGRIVQESGEPAFLGSRDRERWEAAGSPTIGDSFADTIPAEEVVFPFGSEGLSWEELMALPTDPDELEARMRGAASGGVEPTGKTVAEVMFTMVGDLLRESPAPPELRAALYQVAARIPGVRLLGEGTDPAGRPGVAVAMQRQDQPIDERLIIEPETATLLAEVQTLLERVDWVDAQPGTVIGSAVYLESGYVDSTTERP